MSTAFGTQDHGSGELGNGDDRYQTNRHTDEGSGYGIQGMSYTIQGQQGITIAGIMPNEWQMLPQFPATGEGAEPEYHHGIRIYPLRGNRSATSAE